VDAGTPLGRRKKKAFARMLANRPSFPTLLPSMSSDSAENNPPKEQSFELDLSSLGFGPSWVSGPSEKVSSGQGGSRRDGDRPRFRDGPGGERRGPPRDGQGRGPRRDGPGGPRRDDRGPRRDDRGYGRFREEAPVFRPVVASAFFPDDAKFEILGAAMKKSRMTYELFEVARLILDKEDRLSIVIRHPDAEQRPEAVLAVAVPDGHPFLAEAEAVSHVMSRHLDKFFDVVQVEVEAPKGSFPMVALAPDGQNLGAPTHHGYQRALREYHARHCPNMPFDAFKAKVNMSREQEKIDEWLKSMSVRNEYAPKDRKEGEPERLESLDAARGFLLAFRKELVVKSHPWVRFAGRLLEEMNPGPIRDSVRFALEQQRDFPLDTANGIRGRLRKEGFHLYKKGSKGITYACAVRRRCRDPKSTFSDPMAKIFDALDRKPAQQAKDLVLALAGENAEEAAKSQVLTDLSFLIGEGYIANLPDGRLFAQPILSSQAEAKAEAANDEAADEAK
jgi:hypothetical protein